MPSEATRAKELAGLPSFESKTAINCRFVELYNAGMRAGTHGHYETMFGAMHQAYAEYLTALQRSYALSQESHDAQ